MKIVTRNNLYLNEKQKHALILQDHSTIWVSTVHHHLQMYSFVHSLPQIPYYGSYLSFPSSKYKDVRELWRSENTIVPQVLADGTKANTVKI